MRRSLALLLVCAVAILGLTASRSSAQVATVTRVGHLTSLPHPNTGCPASPAPATIMITATVQLGHHFVQMRPFYLALSNGRVLKAPTYRGMLSNHARTATWWLSYGGRAHVDPVLRHSHTRYTATVGSVFHARVSFGCVITDPMRTTIR